MSRATAVVISLLFLISGSCSSSEPEEASAVETTQAAPDVTTEATAVEYLSLVCPDGTEVVGLASLYANEDELFVDKCIPKTTTTAEPTTTTGVFASFSNPVPRGGSVIYDFEDNIVGAQLWEIGITSSVTDVTETYVTACTRCAETLVDGLTRWVKVSVTFENQGDQPVEVAGTFQFVEFAGADAVTRDMQTCETDTASFDKYYTTLLPTGSTTTTFCAAISENDASGEVMILVSGIGHNPLYFRATNQI